LPRRTSRIIAVGIDFAPGGRAALARAAKLAAELGARLDLVHVVPRARPALPFSAANREVVRRLAREEIAAARARLEAWRPRARGLEVRTHVLVGAPAERLLAHARRARAELLVLANRGHGSWEELLIGSTAERVARRATLPVLLIPVPRPRRRRRGR
jgi:nucleotide-binding universal stress UspA family protein